MTDHIMSNSEEEVKSYSSPMYQRLQICDGFNNITSLGKRH
jgi:hypothetical protein